MKNILLHLAALCVVAGPALAHGGTFRPPTDPRYGPKGNLPTTPYSGPGSGRGAYGPPPPGTPGSLLSGGVDAVDMTEWTWWWELHKEIHLQLRARLRDGGVASGSDGFFLGRGQKSAARNDGVGPSREQVRGEVVPALLRRLEAEKSQDVRTSCLIALARIGEDEDATATALEPVLRRHLQDADSTVVETAAIALGILGNDATAFLLGDLVRDTAAGQAAVGKEEVPVRVRAFAAYGLALLGRNSAREDVRRFVVHSLTRGIEEDDTASADLSAACVIALGRVPLAAGGVFPDPGPKTVAASSASLEAQTAYLIELLRDERKLKRVARAHVPTSLGLLASDPALDGGEVKARVGEALLERLSLSRRENTDVLQSCAIGLGLIGDIDDDELDGRIRRTLVALPSRIDDRQARHFALISVGWVSARTGRGDAGGVADLRAHLLRQFTGGRGDTPQWAGLALGLLGRAEAARGELPSTAVVRALHSGLRDAKAPSDIGALCIASGLLRDPNATSLMLDKLARTKEGQARGHAAVGLGMLNAREALVPIRRLADESTYRPDLLRELAIALGLLGDPSVVDLLLDKLGRSSALSAQASIARALGRIGDRRAVTPLVQMLDRATLHDQARAFAAVAVGIVADREELPWNTILGVGLNYNAAPETLFDQQGNGVLNIL